MNSDYFLDEIREGIMNFGPTYYYRGESKCYPKVSSGLYRLYNDIDNEWRNRTEQNKEEILCMGEQQIIWNTKPFLGTNYMNQSLPRQHQAFKEFSDKEKDILVSIQHKGGKTNLIDFTKDIHIALFFACFEGKEENQPKKDGRIILYGKEQYPHYMIFPKTVNSTVQRSVLIRPKIGGAITDQEFHTIIVPKEKKSEILFGLRDFHGIELETLFENLDGYIRNQHLFLQFPLVEY